MKYVYLKMPKSHWRQLVSDYEDMCGVGEEEIEILQDVEELDIEEIKADAAYDGVRKYRGFSE